MSRWVLLAALGLLIACGKAEVAGLGDPTGYDAGVIASDTGVFDPVDVGPVPADSGPSDADLPDIEISVDGPYLIDAFTPDAAEEDAGEPPLDADIDTDAEVSDSGEIIEDAAVSDAGENEDAAVSTDAGTSFECTVDSDCGFFGHCEPVSRTCVDCLVDADCGPGGRICDTAFGFVCRVECFNMQCGPFGFCEPTTNLCVECTMNSHCDLDEVCDPATLSCVGCASDADCALAPNQPICDLSINACTACFDNSHCTSPEECITTGPEPNFCAPPMGRGLCEPCENDDECGGPDDHCIGYLGPTGLYDRSCAIDCAGNPGACPSGFECISVRNGNAEQCRPRYEMNTPTCTATRNLGAACLVDMSALDPGCGVDGVQDARCYSAMSSSTGVCTVWCQDNADCANGTTCMGASSSQDGHCL